MGMADRRTIRADAEAIAEQDDARMTALLAGSLLDSALHRHVVRGLQRYFDDHHQPITRATLGSAAKRITQNIRHALQGLRTEMEDGE
jgi:hypothetical protein